MLWAKKNSYKDFDNEKKFLQLENSPPPNNFSNGPSLTVTSYLQTSLKMDPVWVSEQITDLKMSRKL